MLRERLHAAFKDATDRGDERAVATLRLVLAALKERDHCSRSAGRAEGFSEEDLRAMLRDMVEQRRMEIGRCECCARLDLAEKEAEEISVLERFLPAPMTETETAAAVEAAIQDLGATRLKDTGRVIATLKERFNGQMDFGRVKRLLSERLH